MNETKERERENKIETSPNGSWTKVNDNETVDLNLDLSDCELCPGEMFCIVDHDEKRKAKSQWTGDIK